MSVPYKVPLAPTQKESRGFFRGPADETPWNNDRSWIQHVKGSQRIAMMSSKRFKTPLPPNPPYAVMCDSAMETWTPFSDKSDIRPSSSKLMAGDDFSWIQNKDQQLYKPDLSSKDESSAIFLSKDQVFLKQPLNYSKEFVHQLIEENRRLKELVQTLTAASTGCAPK